MKNIVPYLVCKYILGMITLEKLKDELKKAGYTNEAIILITRYAIIKSFIYSSNPYKCLYELYDICFVKDIDKTLEWLKYVIEVKR